MSAFDNGGYTDRYYVNFKSKKRTELESKCYTHIDSFSQETSFAIEYQGKDRHL